ncbi:serine protease hepsin [Aplysia californica]|uniref:Serine protease hepsin n=1 Tax=Aplysia californica TaxID=6500 RepID=A0ABM1A4F4_APLCA|nr:serine protease hepsin [Aplysia californica]
MDFSRMWSVSIVTLLFVCATCNATPVSIPCSYSANICGVSTVDPMIHRVVGGSVAPMGSWPWTVMLLELGSQVCGGAILSENLVLTAAHCFEGKSIDSHRWNVLAGRHYIDKVDRNEIKVKVQSVIVHEKYNNDTVENDIALLVLHPALTFSPTIRPLCLPPSTQTVSPGQRCMLAGWGDTEGTGSDTALNQAVLPVISDDTCSRADWYGSEFIRSTTFCAGYAEGKKDACAGDSGSPLACKVGGKWYAHGISSWGYDCAEPKWPGIYTDVSKYIPWLQRQMAAHVTCGSSPVVG